jgi:hypothetical protein
MVCACQEKIEIAREVAKVILEFKKAAIVDAAKTAVLGRLNIKIEEISQGIIFLAVVKNFPIRLINYWFRK